MSWLSRRRLIGGSIFVVVMLSFVATSRVLPGQVTAQCQNGIDDDGDYVIDYPDEPGCLTPSDTTEMDPVFQETTQGNISTRIERVTYDGTFHGSLLLMLNNRSSATISNITTVITHDSLWNYLDTQSDWCVKTNATTITCTRTLTAGSGVGATFNFRINGCVAGGSTRTLTVQTTSPAGQSLSRDIRIPACPLPACDDGIDNDGDGRIDFRNSYFGTGLTERPEQTDPGCTDMKDTSEADPVSSSSVASVMPVSSAASVNYQTSLACTSPIRTSKLEPFSGPSTQITTATYSPVYYTTTVNGLVLDRTSADYPLCNGKLFVSGAAGNYAAMTSPPYKQYNSGDMVITEYCNDSRLSGISVPITTPGTQTITMSFVKPNTTTPVFVDGSTLVMVFGSTTDLPYRLAQGQSVTITSRDPQDRPIQTFLLTSNGINSVQMNGLPYAGTVAFTTGIVKTVTITAPILLQSFIDQVTYTAVSCPECDDDIDNDGDGVTDYPLDIGCTAATDTTEAKQCGDGIDNDVDGKFDAPGQNILHSTINNVTLNPNVSAQTQIASGLTEGRKISFTLSTANNCSSISGNLRAQFMNASNSAVGSLFTLSQVQQGVATPATATRLVAWFTNNPSGIICSATNITVYKANDPDCVDVHDNDERSPSSSSVASPITSSNNSTSVSPTSSVGSAGQSNTACYGSYNVVSAPSQITIADLNGDGGKDIITANWLSNNVSVLLNNGDGSFASPQAYPSGSNSGGRIASGDFDRDGKQDILTARQTLNLLKGNGNGTLNAPSTFSSGLSGNIQDILVADFTNDGQLDVVAFSIGGLYLVKGNAGGTFLPAVNIGAYAAGWAEESDFDKDGSMDIVVSDGQNTGGDAGITVLKNNGAGTFTPTSYDANFPNGNSIAMAVGDLTNDGYNDVVVSENGSQRSVYVNKGDGTFNPVLVSSYNNGARSLAIADINGDGKNDLLTGTHTSSNVGVIYGNGDGTFTNTVCTSLNLGFIINDIEVADFNGDGKPDVATPHGVATQPTPAANAVSVLINTNGGLSNNAQCTVVNACTVSSSSVRSSSVGVPVSSSSVTASSVGPTVAECNDTIDNDGDGGIDALATRTSIPSHTFPSAWGTEGQPLTGVRAFVNSLPIPSVVEHQLRYLGNESDAVNADNATATEICRRAGFTHMVSYTTGSYNSPGDSDLAYWNGTVFTFKNAQTGGNSFLASLTCSSPVACGDGVDNDGDGSIDTADSGCASALDESERRHDTDCSSPSDTSEAGSQCSDTLDNDNDGDIDFPEDPGCANAQDNDETDQRCTIIEATTYSNSPYAKAPANLPPNIVVRPLNLHDNQLQAADLATARLFIYSDSFSQLNTQPYRRLSGTELNILKDAYDNGLNFTFAADNPGVDEASQGTRDILAKLTNRMTYSPTYLGDQSGSHQPDTVKYPFLKGKTFNFSTTGGYHTPGDITNISSPAECTFSLGGRCHAAWQPSTNASGFIFAEGNAGFGHDEYLKNFIAMACKPECNDGKDNDGDGVWDMADPGCESILDGNEADEVCKEPAVLLYNLQPIPFTANSDPPMLKELRDAGYNVTYHTRLSIGRFDANFLKQFDIVWFADGCGDTLDLLRTDELAAVETYFKGKGNLVLSTGDAAKHGVQKGDECVARINQIASHLGMTLENAATPGQKGCSSVTGSLPLLNGVSQLNRGANFALVSSSADLWVQPTSQQDVTFSDSAVAASIIDATTQHGFAMVLPSQNPFLASCNGGQAYRNLFGILDMRIGCPCAQASVQAPRSIASWFRRLLSSLLPSRFVAQTTSPATSSCKRTQCNDNIDNDGDTKVDLSDLGCLSAEDDTEQDFITPIGGGICVIVDAGSQNVVTGTMFADCPSNYTLVGGGWKEYLQTNIPNDTSKPAGNSWECERNPTENAVCTAVCCDSRVIESVVIEKKGPLKDHIIAECPAGYTITGGGMKDSIPNKDEDHLGPEESGNAWHCYDDASDADDSSCYAVCSKPKGQNLLACETVQLVAEQWPGVRSYCRSGTVITGGGFIDNTTGNDDEDSSGADGNGWLCADDFGDSPPASGVCFARCCEMPEAQPATVIASVKGPASTQVGSTATYTITLKNISTVPATDAFIRNHLSLPNATLLSVPTDCENKGWQSNGVFAVECHHKTLAPDEEASFQLAYFVPINPPCSITDEVYADAENAFPSNVNSIITSTPCGSSSAQSSSSSSVTITPSTSSTSSSSSAITTSASSTQSSLFCTFNGCLNGGTEFCSAAGELCQASGLSPCFRCGGGSAGSSSGTQTCTFNGCDRGGDQYCSLVNQSCTPSQNSPCFSCGGSLPSSRSSARSLVTLASSSTAPVCSFNGCSQGGSAYCSFANASCIASATSPCFTCAGGADSSASTLRCTFNGCARGGIAYCRAQGKACSPSQDSPCFACEAGTSSEQTVPPSSEGGFCMNDAECVTGFCRDNMCSLCSEANDCAVGLICLNGSCVAPSQLVSAAPELLCGNSILDPEEECEDGNVRDGDTCSAECFFERGRCGDGVVQKGLGEQCESALPLPDGAVCTPRCTLILAHCGNAELDEGEECDDGNANSDRAGARCRRNCSAARCGDGIVDAPVEGCDDGNRFNNDGCSRTCIIEPGARGDTLADIRDTRNDDTAMPQEARYPAAGIPWEQQPLYDAQGNLLTGAVLPAAPSHAPVGQTGPAAVFAMAAGAAAGIGWTRRRTKR